MARSKGKGTLKGGLWRFYETPPFRGLRGNLVPGDRMPTDKLTGIMTAYSALTVHEGDFTTKSTGQVVENLRITGGIRRRHAGVVFRNCWVEGGTAPTTAVSYASILGYGSYNPPGDPMRFYDCTVRGVPTVYAQNGFQGGNTEFYRCDIAGMTDALGFQGGNCKFIASWVHDLTWWANDPWHSDGSHNDGCQIHGGTEYDFIGSRFDMGYKGTSALLIKVATGGGGQIGNVNIDKCWIFQTHANPANGTGIAINIIDQGNTMSGISVTNNIFSPGPMWKVNGGNSASTRVALISAGTRNITTWTNNRDTNGVLVTAGNG